MKTEDGQESSFVSLVLFLVSFFVVIFDSCNQKLSQTQSPTAPAVQTKSDSAPVAQSLKKAESNSKSGPNKISSVHPMIRYYGSGETYNCPSQWRTDHYCARNGVKMVFQSAGIWNWSGPWSTMRNQYGFNGMIGLTPSYIDTAISVGFNFKNLISGLPVAQNDLATWVSLALSKNVSDFYFEEPCNNQNYYQYPLSTAKSTIHNLSGGTGRVWAADYCTGWNLTPPVDCPTNCIIDQYQYADHFGCDKYACSYLSSCSQVISNYNIWRTSFPDRFDFIWIACEAGETSCYQSEFDWMIQYGGIGTVALYLDGSSTWSQVSAFCQQAYAHGYLNMVYRQYHSVYTCRYNNVSFPPACGGGSDYGIWDVSQQLYVKCDNPNNPNCVQVWSWSGNVDENVWSNPIPYGSSITYFGTTSPCP